MQPEITFDAEKHKYFNKFGEEYISTTTLLNCYVKEFDTDKHAARVAEKNDTTPEAIKNMWKDITQQACDKGSAIHTVMENYIKDGTYNSDYSSLLRSFDKATECFRRTSISSEKLLHNHGARIAGTTDVCMENKDEFFLMDFKTNKKFTFSSAFKEFLLPPLDFLHNCKYNIYTLQLSIYAYMYEQLSNKKCAGLKILFLKHNAVGSAFWQEIPALYARDTVEKLFILRKQQILKQSNE